MRRRSDSWVNATQVLKVCFPLGAGDLKTRPLIFSSSSFRSPSSINHREHEFWSGKSNEEFMKRYRVVMENIKVSDS